MRRPLLGVLILTAALGCSDALDPDLAVGTVERDRIELRADSNEPILVIEVTEGSQVAPGDLLLRQDDRSARARLDGARARASAARDALTEALAGTRPEQIAQVRARLAGVDSAVATARAALRRAEPLAEAGFITAERIDVLRMALDQALAERAEAIARLEEAVSGPRAEAVTRLRDELDALEADVAMAELSLERTTLRAPLRGVVEALPFEPGERPPAGAVVVALLASGRAYARVHVPAPLRARIAPGTRAELRVSGVTTPFPGQVRWISAEAAFTPFYALTQRDASRLSFLVEVDIEDSEALPVGLPVTVRFELADPGAPG
ncbi:MAG: HlyD family efflux transporter periplasmic adaptor subunit [Pseudomonadales bacterium]|nr:HlyD family efflux transporter periplasmic adaptor subunit [Pseudomonadales bacterium]